MMHIFDESDGPTIVLVLPVRVVRAMTDALYRYVPGSDRVDGTVDELREQLADWDRLGGEVPTLPGAVVRATVDGLRGGLLCRMPDSPGDTIPWRWGGDTWYSDDELSDVEVLFPGVPS